MSIHVAAVEAQDFHRLSVARVEYVPEVGLVRVTGANASGKTSLLRAIMAALGGAGEVLPDTIRDDAVDGGEVLVKLTNGFTIRRRFTESNPKGYLTVEGPNGAKHKQSTLNDWLGDRAFDPLAFFSLKPDKQREVLLSIATDPELPRKLDQLTAKGELVYEKRTPWIAQERHHKGVKRPSGERPEPVDVSAEMERLEALNAKAREREEARQDVVACDTAIDEAEGEIERPEFVEQRSVKRNEAGVRFNDTPDVSNDIREVRDRINQANAINEQLEPWKEWDKSQKALREAKEQVKYHTEQLKELDREERELLQDSGIPVANLSFSEDGEPLLNGHPLSVASGRERIDVAVAVAMAANPELRICLVDEANDLDLGAIEELAKLAVEHDFQVWLARIGIEGGGEIVVEDGVARNNSEV